MARTGTDTPAAAAKPKVALALQGSFGHIVYAAGILEAFRSHRRSVGEPPGHPGAKAIDFALASGCVEMLTPLWGYLASPGSDRSLRESVVDDNFSEPPAAQVRIASPTVRADAWSSYLSGLVNAQGRWGTAWLRRTTADRQCPGHRAAPGAELNAAWQDLLMYASGIPGQIAFNPLFVAGKEGELHKVCSADTGPTIFTNATRADDLGEIYLYSGSDPNPDQLKAMRGKTGKRQVLRLTPEYFFASGARPPYIAPLPVQVGGRTQHWMEGAMRCNPPLTPLIDMGATHIVLLRFFCKDAKEEPNNNAELNERFLDAVFNIPLQKEIESIEFNNRVARCGTLMRSKNLDCDDLPRRSEVHLIDPGDRDNRGHCASYTDFLHDDLGTLSHYDGLTASRRAEMFDRGVQIGNQLVDHLLPLLP